MLVLLSTSVIFKALVSLYVCVCVCVCVCTCMHVCVNDVYRKALAHKTFKDPDEKNTSMVLYMCVVSVGKTALAQRTGYPDYSIWMTHQRTKSSIMTYYS